MEAGVAGQDVASTYRERCCANTANGKSDALKCMDIPGIHQTMHTDAAGTELEFIGLRTCKEHDQCAAGSFCAWKTEGVGDRRVVANYCSPPQPASSALIRSECYRGRDCESGICINSGVGFAGYCLKGQSEGYQKNGEVCLQDSHCASGACKDWPGAGAANERYCLGQEGDVCADTLGNEVWIQQGLGPNQHPKYLGNTEHDQFNCRGDYYCSRIDGSTGLPWADGLHVGTMRCTRNLPRTHPCSDNAHCTSGNCYCGTCFEVGGMKGGELCADGDALSGYNSADCVSGRCMDWIGADTQCSRVCYSLNDEPCELRSLSIWNAPGDHTHVAGAGRDMACIGPESGFELSCWQNVCTDKPPKGATCYTDASCQNNDPDTMCEQKVCTKASAIPGGAICRNHNQCASGHCWEWYACRQKCLPCSQQCLRCC